MLHVAGPIDERAIDFLGQHGFSMATLEKSQSRDTPPRGRNGEAKVLAQARAIKAKLPDLPVLFYTCSMGWNLAPEEGGYDLYNDLPDRLWLRDVNGRYCTWAGKYRIFDLTQQEMVGRWVASLSSAVSYTHLTLPTILLV